MCRDNGFRADMPDRALANAIDKFCESIDQTFCQRCGEKIPSYEYDTNHGYCCPCFEKQIEEYESNKQ